MVYQWTVLSVANVHLARAVNDIDQAAGGPEIRLGVGRARKLEGLYRQYRQDDDLLVASSPDIGGLVGNELALRQETPEDDGR